MAIEYTGPRSKPATRLLTKPKIERMRRKIAERVQDFCIKDISASSLSTASTSSAANRRNHKGRRRHKGRKA
jgi:hypothetical protein